MLEDTGHAVNLVVETTNVNADIVGKRKAQAEGLGLVLLGLMRLLIAS
jgi:hypothetical protein